MNDTLIGGKKLKKWDIIQTPQTPTIFIAPAKTLTIVESIGFIERFIGNDFQTCWNDCDSYNLCGFENKTTKISLGCNLVNIKDISENVNFKLTPNPVQNHLKIDAPNLNIKSLKIYDINGKAIINTAYTEGGVIDVSDLAKGIYFVQLIDYQLNSVLKKFIKE